MHFDLSHGRRKFKILNKHYTYQISLEEWWFSKLGFMWLRVWKKVKVAQSCPTLCDPMDCTVHEILQARVLEWVAFPFSRGSSHQGSNPGLPHCRQILYQLSHNGSPRILEWVAYPFSVDSSNPGMESESPALQAGSLPTELSGKLLW